MSGPLVPIRHVRGWRGAGTVVGEAPRVGAADRAGPDGVIAEATP